MHRPTPFFRRFFPTNSGAVALYAAAALGAAAAGGLLAGLIAERLGVQFTFLGIGIGLLLAAVRFRSRLELLRTNLRPIYQALGIPPRSTHQGSSTPHRGESLS